MRVLTCKPCLNELRANRPITICGELTLTICGELTPDLSICIHVGDALDKQGITLGVAEMLCRIEDVPPRPEEKRHDV